MSSAGCAARSLLRGSAGRLGALCRRRALSCCCAAPPRPCAAALCARLRRGGVSSSAASSARASSSSSSPSPPPAAAAAPAPPAWCAPAADAPDDPSAPPWRRNVVDVLRERGLVDACTDEAGLRAAASAAGGPLRAYCGFDPTADSLHLGNLLGVVVLAWFQRCGHTPVALVGGATGRVGDPSGKSAERPLLSDAELRANADAVRSLLARLLRPQEEGEEGDGGGGGAEAASGDAARPPPLPAPLLLDNSSWLGAVPLVDFLRDVGRHARMGAMLAKDSVRTRLGPDGDGLSFTEFTYQLLQAADFAHLRREEGVAVQVGGSDQWGNITAGVELMRRTGVTAAAPASAAAPAATPAFGLTFPLLLKSDGTKFGKSESGAVWLSAERLSPYKLYQHLYATPDGDAEAALTRLTLLPMAAVRAAKAAAAAPGAPPGSLQRLLASEVVRFVHGPAGLRAALRTTAALAPGAAGGGTAAGGEAGDGALAGDALAAMLGEVPCVELRRRDVLPGAASNGEAGGGGDGAAAASPVAGMSVAELAVAAGMQPTKAAARRLIAGGGVYLNGRRVADERAAVAPADALGAQGLLLLACGKKNKTLVRLVD